MASRNNSLSIDLVAVQFLELIKGKHLVVVCIVESEKIVSVIFVSIFTKVMVVDLLEFFRAELVVLLNIECF